MHYSIWKAINWIKSIILLIYFGTKQKLTERVQIMNKINVLPARIKFTATFGILCQVTKPM